MDAPRRWQAASLVTAVASLGVGGALLARPAIDVVPSIDLDRVETRVDRQFEPSLPAGGSRDDVGPLIVLPPSIPDTSLSASAASTHSLDSPAGSDDTSSGAGPATQPTTEPAPQHDGRTAPTKAASASSVDSSDAPASAASVDSVDSSD